MKSYELPPLTPRLKAIAESVPTGSITADIGTDHAYIPVYLALLNICPRCFAGDIGEGPLKNAEKAIKYYGVEDKVTPILSAGLDNFPSDSANTVIVAGMGGDQVAEIIKNCEWLHKKGITLILQPMTMHDRCRKLLAVDGFKCMEEKYVREGNRIYTVMVYEYLHPHTIDEVTSHIGLAKGSNDPLAAEYIKRRVEKLSRMAEGMEKSDTQKDEAAKLRKIIDDINVAICR